MWPRALCISLLQLTDHKACDVIPAWDTITCGAPHAAATSSSRGEKRLFRALASRRRRSAGADWLHQRRAAERVDGPGWRAARSKGLSLVGARRVAWEALRLLENKVRLRGAPRKLRPRTRALRSRRVAGAATRVLAGAVGVTLGSWTTRNCDFTNPPLAPSVYYLLTTRTRWRRAARRERRIGQLDS